MDPDPYLQLYYIVDQHNKRVLLQETKNTVGIQKGNWENFLTIRYWFQQYNATIFFFYNKQFKLVSALLLLLGFPTIYSMCDL